MTINRQVNKNISKDEYFNNKHIIEVKDLNIKVEVYSHNLRASKVAHIESEIRETATNFKDAFKLEPGSSEQTFKIYVFDDKADYTHLGGSERFGSYLGDEGGKCYYKGEADIFAEMYVYQQGGVHNLQHEFAHGLTYLATGGKPLPTVLMEGIADYFEHHSDHKFNAQGSSIDKTEAANLDLDKILSLKYSNNSEENSLVYKTGHALIMYLQEKDPSLLRDYLEALCKGDSHKSGNFLDQIRGHNDAFKDWLDLNDTETAMEHLNALQVTKGDFIATGQEIVGGEIKNISYYKANIEKIDGENVGSFSAVEHVSFYDYARAVNRATNDTLDISKEYHFLKAVKTTDGQVKLTYSDQQGNEYQNSQEYKNQALRTLSNYDENLKKVYDNALKDLDEQIRKESAEVREKYHKQEISYEELLEKYNFITSSSRYEELKKSLLDEMIDTGSKQLKATQNIDVEKMLEEMVNIDPNLIRGAHINLQEGKVFSIKALGHGDMGALSIYEGNTKLGELSSESGFFKQVEGQTKETFVFEDILHNLNTQYDGGAYMAVTKENGQYKASLIDGRTVERDEYFDEAHLHENELLHPSTGHIQKDLDSLLLRGTKILNHQDSEHAQYSDEQKANGVIVEKGKLLDNKGTDRTDDDVYEAVVKQGDERLHEFKNMGFYITEKGDLFIHDHGVNVRFQLPTSITHLKLVEKDGAYKLAPSDKYGTEYRYDVRGDDIPDEYRYIDPIFAHEYEKRDYSHKHVNVGLINLEKYGSGKLFAIKYDPNDYHIQRNSSGEIVRIKDQTYFTKVKLFDGDEEIGMLSNNFHNFKGKIFFSADYNYSYNDFLASVSPQVEIENMGNGSKKITFDQGSGDIGDTNRGYTDYQRIFTKEKQTESPKGQVSETKTEVHSTTNVVAEERNDNSEIQSDQPQIPTRAKRSASVEEKEQVVLKDTILKIEKSYDRDVEGKHKANVIIDYNDVKALYNRAEGADKQSVLDFWNKLHTSDYKIGALPEDKYYFKDGKFLIHDSDTKKLIVLPEDKVSVKIMKDGDSYSLAISNGNGKVISSISKIDNPNYELLSDSSHFSLETQDNIELSDQHHEYNLYLENGFVTMFDCASDHVYHDHNSAYI
ncbi:peptidase M2 [Wolbachia endosymbiont of Diaphorina citri]|nr:peptidase M2 [Wolbachia endosymbiont of Diaphorina citri]QJT96319.1 peptidase M2 [Wolbachia endosymbiont of Diaphorina citri]QJT97578.1 peptidase M2 [Wolbachia endosymbiont of Diaphorina citri]QLK12058.1 peptidase M2 [Wolbachia endosymbiont of Diaphorina citri]QXY87664.1 peptidase M2 [Wolbachia endosymbiont of Diaphorina citri]